MSLLSIMSLPFVYVALHMSWKFHKVGCCICKRFRSERQIDYRNHETLILVQEKMPAQYRIPTRVKHKQPVGWKTAPAFWVFLKKMSFSPKRNYWSSSQKSLNFPRENQVVLTQLPVIYRHFCAENSPFFVPLSDFHALLQHATCFLQNIFFGVLPTPLPNPAVSHQFRIDVAVHPGRKATWNGWSNSLHIESTPPAWIRILLFFILFLMQKIPLEWLQASCHQPNLALKDL